jgi:hypothetical protein
MKERLWLVIALCAALLALAPACGDDDSAGPGADAGTDTDTDTDTDGDGDAGAWCDQNEDCVTGFCETYVSVPASPDGLCAEGPAAGQIRVMGNVRDYRTGEFLAGYQVKVTAALAALADPDGATPLITATTGADGLFDVVLATTSAEAPVGLVGVVPADADYFLTITGLVEPENGGQYPLGIRNHDVRVVDQATVDEWSGYLESFPELDTNLPLGTAGAVLGSILYVGDGTGVSGANLVSSLGEDSVAKIYYLNEAGDGFNTDATGASGLFVLFGPSLGEKFEAYVGSEKVSRLPATMGQTPGSIYNNTVQVEGP